MRRTGKRFPLPRATPATVGSLPLPLRFLTDRPPPHLHCRSPLLPTPPPTQSSSPIPPPASTYLAVTPPHYCTFGPAFIAIRGPCRRRPFLQALSPIPPSFNADDLPMRHHHCLLHPPPNHPSASLPPHQHPCRHPFLRRYHLQLLRSPSTPSPSSLEISGPFPLPCQSSPPPPLLPSAVKIYFHRRRRTLLPPSFLTTIAALYPFTSVTLCPGTRCTARPSPTSSILLFFGLHLDKMPLPPT